MKKFLILFCTIGALAAAQRSVLVEAFTSTTCPYCPYANAASEWLVDSMADTVSVIQYMSGLSGSDATVRANFYGVSGVPDVWFTGAEDAVGSYSDTARDYRRYKGFVNNWKYVMAPLIIRDVIATVDAGGNGSISCVIDIESTLPSTDPDPRVFCAITERGVFGDGRYNRYIMRDIISSPTGDSLLATQAGDTQNFSWSFSTGSWNTDSLNATIFVQSMDSKLVFQSKQVQIYPTGTGEDRASGPVKDQLRPGTERLILNISTKSQVKVVICDPTGRTVARIYSGEMSKGQHAFKMPDLRPGAYIAVAATERGVVSAGFVR